MEMPTFYWVIAPFKYGCEILECVSGFTKKYQGVYLESAFGTFIPRFIYIYKLSVDLMLTFFVLSSISVRVSNQF